MAGAENLNSVIARLPWIASTTCGKLRIKDTKFFKEMMHNDVDDGAYNLLFYRFLNATVPLYLPGRYYSMDCNALHANSKKGQYWAYASQQLVHNQAMGILFTKIGLSPQSAVCNMSTLPAMELSTLTRVAESVKSAHIFKEAPELCESAAEFILDPWVLIQLPWHPVMFHQWLAAVLAETLKFEKEIAEFYHWPVADLMMPTLNNLVKIREELRTVLNCGLISLFMLYSTSPAPEGIQQAVPQILNDSVLPAIPYLRFILSKDCSRLIMSLKKILWTNKEREKGPLHPTSMILFHDSTLEKLIHLYNPKFWKCDKKADELFGTMEGFEKLRLTFEQMEEVYNKMIPGSWSFDEDWNIKMRNVNKDVDWDAVKKLVEEEILETKMLGSFMILFGLTKRSYILDLVPGDMYLAHYYLMYVEYDFAKEAVRESDHGVVYDVLKLNCEAKRAYAIAAMASHLHYLYFKKTTHGLTLNPSNCRSVKKVMKLTEIKATLKKLSSESGNDKITLGLLKQQLLSTSDAKKLVKFNEKCPNMEQLTAEKVALQLQLRIKKVVLKMINSFYASLEGPKKYFNEMQFVQFILPCFVASYLDMHKDKKIPRANVAWYLKFVHQLIQSFEVKENDGTAVDSLFQRFCCSFLVLAQNIPMTIFWKSELIEIIIGKATLPNFDLVNTDINSLPCILKMNGFDVLTGLHRCKDMVTKGLDQTNLCSSILGAWSFQLNKYFCRILDVLRNCAPPTGIMNNIRLLDGAITCQMMLNYIMQSINSSLIDKFFPQGYLLMDLANAKVQQRCGLKTQPKFKGCLTSVSAKQALLESKILSAEQLLGIVMHFCVVARNCATIEPTCTFRHGNFFIHDTTETAFVSFTSKDWVKMKLLLSWMLGGDATSHDKSVVPFEFAKYVAPCSYQFALSFITDKRLDMEEPAQMTSNPLIHCRWCGLVDGELFMCKECKQIENYPDKNWFCSEICEQRALDKVHREEHARDLTIRIGIEDRVVKLVD